MDVACYSDVADCSRYYEAERVAAVCQEQVSCGACTVADDTCAWDGKACFSTANAWQWDSAWVREPEQCDSCVAGAEDLSNPCQPKTCVNGIWATSMTVCPEAMGTPCEGGSYEPALEGECCSRCVQELAEEDENTKPQKKKGVNKKRRRRNRKTNSRKRKNSNTRRRK